MASFHNDDSFKGKADKLLGLNDNSDDQVILVQMSGWLQKSELNKKSWKKLFFVVKDGFLLWYLSPKADGMFDTKPKGVLPLGGSVISLDFSNKDTVVVSNPDLSGSGFRLRASDPVDAMDWITALERGKKATWENALLGNALVEKMKTSGNKLEAEKEAAFQELQKKAQKLSEVQEQKNRVLRRDIEREETFKSKLDAEKQRINDLEDKRVTIMTKLGEEAHIRKQASRKRMSVERKLAKAEQALQKIEDLLLSNSSSSHRPSQSGDQMSPRERAKSESAVKANVTALRSFFEAKNEEQTMKARQTYERMI